MSHNTRCWVGALSGAFASLAAVLALYAETSTGVPGQSGYGQVLLSLGVLIVFGVAGGLVGVFKRPVLKLKKVLLFLVLAPFALTFIGVALPDPAKLGLLIFAVGWVAGTVAQGIASLTGLPKRKGGNDGTLR